MGREKSVAPFNASYRKEEAKFLNICFETTAKTRNRKLEDFNSFSQTGFSVLESRLQSDVPEPAFNGRNGLVVAVFKITNYER